MRTLTCKHKIWGENWLYLRPYLKAFPVFNVLKTCREYFLTIDLGIVEFIKKFIVNLCLKKSSFKVQPAFRIKTKFTTRFLTNQSVTVCVRKGSVVSFIYFTIIIFYFYSGLCYFLNRIPPMKFYRLK